MVTALKLAITGATGFVGARLLDQALVAGHSVRALTRRPQPPRDNVTWIEGALDRPVSLDALAEGRKRSSRRGVINARRSGVRGGQRDWNWRDASRRRTSGNSALRPRQFPRGARTRAVALRRLKGPLRSSGVRLTTANGDRPSARHLRPGRPRIARNVQDGGARFCPPPAARSPLPACTPRSRPPLCSLSALPDASAGVTFEPGDGSQRLTHREFAEALGKAVGRKVRTVSMPPRVLALAARADRLARGSRAKLTPDRAAYFSHPDWVADPARAVPSNLWQPSIPTPQGLAETAAWYRSAGWL